MSDSLTNFVMTGKGGFGDLAKSIIANMVKIEAQVLASQLLMSIFGGGATGYSASDNPMVIASPTYNAIGGVYSSPSLSRYSGQIVSKPTVFAFASGAGVMGEAGPEAIMPLKRGSDGKLGVASSGGGDVYLTVENNGQPANARTEQTTAPNGDRFIKLILDAAEDRVAGSIAKGGKVAQATQQRFGLSRRGVPVGG